MYCMYAFVCGMYYIHRLCLYVLYIMYCTYVRMHVYVMYVCTYVVYMYVLGLGMGCNFLN